MMNKNTGEIISVEEFDRIFDEGEEDVLQFFDTDNEIRPNLIERPVTLSLPNWVIKRLDIEAQKMGVAMQDMLKVWLAERVKQEIA
ncbi:MAG: BrnA antitoxin family protein [Oscillospiraceae bacterium]|nr:BrnA antitoxin family protein [Oscillospiraceae bacterium]